MSQCDGLTGIPEKSQKEGQENQGWVKELGAPLYRRTGWSPHLRVSCKQHEVATGWGPDLRVSCKQHEVHTSGHHCRRHAQVLIQ